MWSFCGCLSEEEARGEDIDKRITRQIQKDKLVYMSTCRFLLLGSEESGKSTILKQLRILHGDGIGEEEKLQLGNIRKNIRDSVLTISSAMSSSTQPVALEHPENQLSVDYIQNLVSQPDFEYPSEFYDHTEKLWNDRGVQSCIIEGYNEFQLTDCAKYFLDKVGEIKQPNYMPSEQDILRCNVPTCGIFESRFQLDGVKYHVIDVGGQIVSDRRKKWTQVFDNARAIIFVTDCSSFNTVLREDNTCQNRLQESLELFMSIWNNQLLREINVILFLNKQDLLREKLQGGKWKLEDYFPDFASYQTPGDATSEPGDDHEYIRARYFIRDEFLRICAASTNFRRECIPIFTCALETENIRRVFDVSFRWLQTWWQEYFRPLSPLK